MPGLVLVTHNDVVGAVRREHVPGAAGGVSRVDELWSAAPPEKTLNAISKAYAGMHVIQTSLVREHTIFERRAGNAMLVKRLSLLQRKPGLSRTEFCAYWRDVHATMATCHGHVARYVQNHVVGGAGAEFDGIAEFQIIDLAGMQADYDTEAGKAMKSDVQNFAATVSTYVVRAHDMCCA